MNELNVLLVMPRIVNKVGSGYVFPLGLPYISSSLKQAGFHIFTYNLNHHEGDIREILEEQIQLHNINAVFTGGMSFQYYPIYELIEAVRSINKEIFILVGGGIITADPKAAMDALEYADVGVIGEGEITDVEVCNALQTGLSLEKIDGLIIRQENNTYHITPPRKEIEDLDTIPWPDYDGFEVEKSFEQSPGLASFTSKRVLTMLGSRSCPYQCSFCFHTVGKKYRQRSLDDFFAELAYNIEKYHIEYLFLADELFTFNNERVEEFCRRIKPYHIKWWAQFRVDSLDDWVLEMAKDSGCVCVTLGLESADNQVLKSMGKHITIEQTDATLKKIKKIGIPIEGSFIFGDEAETYETANNTLAYWLKNRDYRINLNTITVFPGCRLYKNAILRGIIKDPVQYLKDGCPQLNITKMTNFEYGDIIKKIMEYPHMDSKKLESFELLSVDYENMSVSIKAKCSVCHTETTFSDVKLFTIGTLDCTCCGQRYFRETPKEILQVINKNLQKLIDQDLKIAVWGVNRIIFDLFDSVPCLLHKNIFPIDSSEAKQQIKLNGKSVYPPAVIEQENLDAIIIPIPAYFNTISLQIKYQYPNVKKVIDIGDMIHEDYQP